MPIQLVLQFDDESKVQQIMNLVKRLQIPFQIKATQDIEWHWLNCDLSEVSIETFSEDWGSEADKIWDNILEKTYT